MKSHIYGTYNSNNDTGSLSTCMSCEVVVATPKYLLAAGLVL